LKLFYPFLNVFIFEYDCSQLTSILKAVLLEQILDCFERIVDLYIVNMDQETNDRKKIDNTPVLLRFKE